MKAHPTMRSYYKRKRSHLTNNAHYKKIPPRRVGIFQHLQQAAIGLGSNAHRSFHPQWGLVGKNGEFIGEIVKDIDESPPYHAIVLQEKAIALDKQCPLQKNTSP